MFKTAITDQLHVINYDGTQARLVTEAATKGLGGAWLTDQSFAFTNRQDRRLHEISLDGGESRALPIPLAVDETQGLPVLIPGQQWLLYTVILEASNNFYNGRIDAYNLVTGESKTVVKQAYNARFAASDHLVFLRDGDLWAASINPNTAQLRGVEAIIEKNVAHHSGKGNASYSFSDAGRLVFQGGGDGASVTGELVLSDTDGNERLHNLPENAFHSTFSPDGKSVATIIRSLGRDAYVAIYNIASGTLSRRSFVGDARNPIWTPDGMQLVYSVITASGSELWLINADGSDQAEQLLSQSGYTMATSISPDGKSLVLNQFTSGNGAINLFSFGERENLVRDLISESTDIFVGKISPDGRWIAYAKIDLEGVGVYVRPFPNVEDGLWQIASSEGVSTEPLWGANGKTLYYVHDYILNRVDVNTDSGFSISKPTSLFELTFKSNHTPNYTLSSDSQMILYRAPVDSGAIKAKPTSLVLVENWFEKLNQMAPPSPE